MHVHGTASPAHSLHHSQDPLAHHSRAPPTNSGIPRAFHSSLELALYNVALFETLIHMCSVLKANVAMLLGKEPVSLAFSTDILFASSSSDAARSRRWSCYHSHRARKSSRSGNPRCKSSTRQKHHTFSLVSYHIRAAKHKRIFATQPPHTSRKLQFAHRSSDL